MLTIPPQLCRFITKFRLSNTKLPIETGRYHNIERNRRYCTLCEANCIGDEYHLVFECKNVNIVNIRTKYIPLCYLCNPSRHKLVTLLKNVKYKKIGVALAQFLKETNLV